MCHNTDTTLTIFICTPSPKLNPSQNKKRFKMDPKKAIPSLDGLVSICFLFYSSFNSHIFYAVKLNVKYGFLTSYEHYQVDDAIFSGI